MNLNGKNEDLELEAVPNDFISVTIDFYNTLAINWSDKAHLCIFNLD